MAYTASMVVKSVFGNQRMEIYIVTADAASGAVQTGVPTILAVNQTPISMATAAGKFKANLSVTSGVASGSVFISSIASGDNFYLQVYGH